MQTLSDLYVQSPFWLWLGVGAACVALDLVTGTGRLIWPGAVAAALAFINLAKVRLGAPVEVGAIVFAAALAGALTLVELRRSLVFARTARRVQADGGDLPRAARTRLLIGLEGRTTREFANGVGRVSVDGLEWAAELDGDEALPPDAPVRVTGVTGGVRLRVRGLAV